MSLDDLAKLWITLAASVWFAGACLIAVGVVKN